MASRPAIEVIEVRKSFGRTAALDGLSTRVPEGGVSALLGPNGAGKTTLVRILATLLVPAGRRPSLDEVFLDVLGHRAEDGTRSSARGTSA